MALPPERLGELVREATLVFVGEVLEVLARGAEPPQAPPRSGGPIIDDSIRYAAQRLRVRVERVLAGDAGAEVTLDKPEAAYGLAVGARGPFFVKGERILGRYGPDTRPLDEVLAHYG